ncbi:MAG: hypothetical protein L3J32_09440, partial [Rhizobiaceae bacterium]|nr:hypothetical protein [Rhizobiaceae bacterium]
GKYLFALLQNGGNTLGGAGINASAVFNDKRQSPGLRSVIEKVVSQPPDVPREILKGDYPMLVTFTDINNPASIKQVDPNDLDAVFGCSNSKATADVIAGKMPWREKRMTWYQYQTMLSNQELERRRKTEPAKRKSLKEREYALTLEFNKRAQKLYSAEAKKNSNQMKKERSRLYIELGYKKKQEQIKYEKRQFVNPHHVLKDELEQLRERGRDNLNDCYKLKSITLEITDETVTEGKVEDLISWLETNRSLIVGPTEDADGKQIFPVPRHGGFILRK